jgi:peptide/nickel transport system substrate-binding protein
MKDENKPTVRQTITRRQFLGIAVAGTAGAALVACATPPTEAPVQAPTQAPTQVVAASATPAPTLAPTATTAPLPTPTEMLDLGFMRAPEPNPKTGGILRHVIAATTPHYDLHQGAVGNGLSHTYNGLVRWNVVDGFNSIIPELAKEWEISSDGLVYTFSLRQNVKFHDGTPFTADDVVATFNRIINPPEGITSVFKNLYGPVQSIEAVDTNTVRFTLSKPYFMFMEVLATDAPGAVYPKKWLDENAQDLRKVVAPGTGPFRYVEYKEGEFWKLERNPEYWDPVLPYLNGIEVIHTPTADDRGVAVLTDRADWSFMTGLNSWKEGEKRGEVAGVSANTSNSTRVGVQFNCNKAPFNDPRVRRAVLLARNLDDWIKVFGQYETMHFSHWVLEGEPVAMPTEEIRKIAGFREDKTEDIAEAKRLLAEAGFADGIKNVDMIAIQGHTTYHLAVALQAELKQHLNIEVNLRAQERNLCIEDESKGNYDLSVNFWPGAFGITDFGIYAATFFKTGAGGNTAKYANPALDSLIDAYLSEMDVEKRKGLMRQIEETLDQDPPRLLAGTGIAQMIWRNTVKGMALEKRRTLMYRGMETAWLDI